ncbi:ATP synthase F0 complex subunit D mitochondrial [Trinorchestia longiramus]|nr:ATP synthase F0 complex subunit D mitochondrial [Trinorchestia longiramus]
MASKRVAQSTVNWTAFAQKVPKEQMAQFNAFKSKSDGYAAKVAMLPQSLPAINWAQYEGRVAVPNMVAEFKKQYEAVSVPYPKDIYTTKINEQEKSEMAEVAQYVKECQEQIVQMKAELVRVQALMPLEDMNMEEYFDAYPDEALDTFARPTMWPHTPESQPEYLEQMEKEGKFDDAH